jgi:glycoprotein endo-alpha-1,2-mannosidase
MRRLLLIVLIALVAAAPARAGRSPRVAVFYYSWYSTADRDGDYLHWAQNGRYAPFQIASNFYPARGVYSSADPTVVSAQMADIASARIDEVVVSWWGWGSLEDLRLPEVMHAAKRRGLTVGIHIEPYPGRTAESVAADVTHLRTLGVSDFYVYDPATVAATDWAAANASLTGVRLFAQTSLVGFAAASRFTGVYTYDVLQHSGASFGRLCTQARRAGLLCAPSVAPGYDARQATGDTRVKPRRNGKTYDGMWRAALRSDADLVTITSYNEWHEGTQIEPAQKEPDGLGYLSYDGAWGRHGAAAERAYLWRTAFWSRRFRAQFGA